MRIWIDADACPRAVKEIIFRAAERKSIPVSVVANKAMYVPRTPLITMVHVAGGPDVADDHIVEKAAPGDVVITQDIPLAARLVELKAQVMSPRGEVFDEENVRERLSMRDFMTELREGGIETGGPKAFSDKDKNKFASALNRALQRAG